MPVLALLTGDFADQQPFAGLTVAACLHVTAGDGRAWSGC